MYVLVPTWYYFHLINFFFLASRIYSDDEPNSETTKEFERGKVFNGEDGRGSSVGFDSSDEEFLSALAKTSAKIKRSKSIRVCRRSLFAQKTYVDPAPLSVVDGM